ncbi:MAG: hypothetical protein WB989_21880, partial [Mycobacterium sp.]
SHLASVGALAVRALPVVLLTALVFFNTYVWIMAATINGKRLLLAMVFLVSVAAVFVISGTMPDPKPDPDGSDPFRPTWIERLNVVFVLATSQLVQISVVAALTGTLYLVLGLIVLTPELLNTISDVDAR